MDDAIATVVGVTGSTPELAAQYVQLADGDPNQAVQLFFENGGADLAGTTSSHPPQPSTSHPTGAARDPIDLDAEDNISDDNDPEITGFRSNVRDDSAAHPAGASTYEDDEALARRLQNEMYGEGAMEDQVRAPIARQAETLVGPGADVLPSRNHEEDDAVTATMLRLARRRDEAREQARQRAGIFNQYQPPTSIWDNDDGSDRDTPTAPTQPIGGASESSIRTSRLTEMFRPPWGLMYKGGWQDARDQGKEQKKWIIVDIQDASIFDCQALNRDLWKNDGIVETIKENFIFIQYNKNDARATQYNQYYFQDYENSDAYPHVAIVDPRTGEQIKLWSRKLPSAGEFLMQLHEFLDRYSLDNHARNPVAKRKSEAKKEKPVDQLTEEEMLERALQASLASQSEETGLKPPAAEDPDDLTRSIGELRGTQVQDDAMDVDEKEDSEESAFLQIPSTRPHSEPAAGPGITRVQIRHPAGRIVRRFAEQDLVQRIYEYLKAEPPEGKEGLPFQLVSMGKNLIELRHDTIEGAGLKNGTVMVEFVES